MKNRRRHAVTPIEAMPLVSVIVCAFNDERHLDACLTSLLQQTYPTERREIILVDDGSTDGTAVVAARFEPVKYIYQHNQGPSIARNTGIKNARGEVILFTDSDCEAAPDWISQLVAALVKSAPDGIIAVGGRQRGHPQDPPFAQKVDRYLNAIGFVGDYVKPHSTAKLVSHNASCNSAYRRAMLIKAGGFRPGMFPGEDVDLDQRLMRMGYKILFTPLAVVFHHRADSRRRWIGMLMNYGRAQADNIAIHGFFRPIHIVPPIMMMSLLVLALILWQGSFILGALMLMLGIAAPAVYIKKRDLILGWNYVLYFTITTSIYYFVGFWRRALQNAIRPKFPLKHNLDIGLDDEAGNRR
jgi:succinoglycan biosynthesis protein ExoA